MSKDMLGPLTRALVGVPEKMLNLVLVRVQGFTSASVAQQPNVAVDEDPVPGDEHVVEEDNAVHFFESRSQRMVEMGFSLIEAVSAQEAQALGVAG